MNAYELAKYLATEKPDGISYRFAAGNAAIMLRQQADRIALLENIVMDCDAILRKASEK